MNAEQIISLIEERLDIASRLEQQADRDYLGAKNETARQVAGMTSQRMLGQRLILQTILDEINDTDEA